MQFCGCLSSVPLLRGTVGRSMIVAIPDHTHFFASSLVKMFLL